MHHTRNYQGVLVLMCYTKIAYEQSEVKMSELKKIKNRFKPAHFHKQLYTYIMTQCLVIFCRLCNIIHIDSTNYACLRIHYLYTTFTLHSL